MWRISYRRRQLHRSCRQVNHARSPRLGAEQLEKRYVLASMLVTDINTTPVAIETFPDDFVAMDDKSFFTATNEFGRELWVTDGTTEGTEMVADLQPGERSSNPRAFTPVGDLLWFVADMPTDGLTNTALNSLIYLTDGNPENTHAVAEIDLRPGTSLDDLSSARAVEFQGSYFFSGIHSRVWHNGRDPETR